MLLPLLAIACSNGQTNNKSFLIQGSISGHSGTISLNKVQDGEIIEVGTTETTDGTFELKGSVDFPELYYLYVGSKRKKVSFFLENSTVQMNGHIDSLTQIRIKGSKSQDDYKRYNTEISIYRAKSSDLYKQYSLAQESKDSVLKAQIETEYGELTNERSKFVKNFIQENNASEVSPYIIRRELIYELDAMQLDSVLNLLAPALSASVYVKELKERVSILKNVAIGMPAPDFAFPDTSGVELALSSLQGKYVLIDFWAAWCGPCRRENPNNVKMYAKYNNKGFEILGVSFDDNRAAWVKAIIKDELTWPQISDLKGWKCAAAKLYGVNGIPHTVLVDPKGIIIDKDLRGEDLENKLIELFGE